MPQHQVDIAEQRAAAGQHDPLVDDVGGEFGGRVLERHLNGLDDRADRFGQALGNLTLADHDLLWHAVHLRETCYFTSARKLGVGSTSISACLDAFAATLGVPAAAPWIAGNWRVTCAAY